jgi:DNA-binding transcriptional MerR regulator
MSGYPNPSNRRQSVRCPVIGHRQDGELRVGGKRLKVFVMDESAGGFSVLCENTMGLQVEDCGLLRAGDDWYEIRVTFVGEADSVPVDESDGKPRYRLGLYRVADTYNPDLKSSFVSWAGLTSRLKYVGPGGSNLIMAGILFAVIAVAGPVITLMVIGSGAGKPGPRNDVSLDDSSNPDSSWISPQTQGQSTNGNRSTRSNSANSPGSAPGGSNAMKQIGMTLDEIRARIDRLPGAEPFAMPAVEENLQMTESQRSRIDDLVEAAHRLMKQLGLSADSDDPRVKEIGDLTRTQALEILDANQREKWDELFGEKQKRKGNGAQEKRKP